jgi:hypothetical protein
VAFITNAPYGAKGYMFNPLQYATTMDAVDRLILSSLKQEKVFIEYLRDLFGKNSGGEKECRAENIARPAVAALKRFFIR